MLIKEATSICKTILRNGFDAYVINATLQGKIYDLTQEMSIDVASEADSETLSKLFPLFEEKNTDTLLGTMQLDNVFVYFYPVAIHKSGHPEFGLMQVSPHMLKVLQERQETTYQAIAHTLFSSDPEDSFEARECGYVALKGVPYRTLQRNYALAITALRMAANYNLPIEPTTWLAIVRSSHRISDFLATSSFVEEMRLVAAENLWKFVQLLSDSFILHNMLPEIAALHLIKQQRNKEDLTEISAFEHTVECMRYYPEENLHHDWIGTLAVLFHGVGKLYTAENYQGHWTFFQYHKIGAQVARSILRRLNFPKDEVTTICDLIRNHIRFHSMLTDRGIRRFLSLPDTDRIIEMTRAHIKATGLSYTNFNHNLKYLERADTPETMLEPLLNGNEIMELTNLSQGREIGILRKSLLEAQKAGKVQDRQSAVDFVRNYIIED